MKTLRNSDKFLRTHGVQYDKIFKVGMVIFFPDFAMNR
jgi:hypothetical protein